VLEQAPAQGLREALASAPSELRPLLVPLSAHSEAALAELAAALREELAQAGGSQPLGDLAYTLARRRSHRAQRLAIVARARLELAGELERFAAGAGSPAARSGVASPGKTPGVVFAFSGHGGHWAGMGRVLLAREPVFRAAIEEWDREQAKHVDWSLAEQIERAAGGAALERIDVLQPALTGIAIAVARLFAHWGIEPCAVLGHSGGEIAAAQVAGCLELRDAARIACARGQVVRELAPPGAMALVALPADALAEDLAPASGRIEIAGSNSPTLTIVSGDCIAIDALVDTPEHKGKALEVPLDGVRSARASRDRCRVLYEIDAGRRAIVILKVGPRKDVYRSR
jgi:acyl transferase domain-containing protein